MIVFSKPWNFLSDFFQCLEKIFPNIGKLTGFLFSWLLNLIGEKNGSDMVETAERK